MTSSSRVLAPSKTAARSASTAAGPVTSAVTPSGRSARTTSRRSVTWSALSVALVASIGTTASAAVPSLAGTSCTCGPSPAAVSSSDASASGESCWSELNSTIATDASSVGSWSRSSVASVLSIPRGSESVGEASWSPSPSSPMSAPANSSGIRATSHAVRRPVRTLVMSDSGGILDRNAK